MPRRILIAAVILHVLGGGRGAVALAAPPGRAPEAPAPKEEAPAPKDEAKAPAPAGGEPRALADPHQGKPMVNPHGAAGKALCDRCHEPGATRVKKDPIALCAECHDPARMRHPFRVEAPARAKGLPLMSGRVIACHTCHDPHDVKARRGGLRMGYAQLCLECHDQHPPKRDAAGGVHGDEPAGR